MVTIRIDAVSSIDLVTSYEGDWLTVTINLDDDAFTDLCTGVDRLRDGKPQFKTTQEMREEAERAYHETLVKRYPVLYEDPFSSHT